MSSKSLIVCVIIAGICGACDAGGGGKGSTGKLWPGLSICCEPGVCDDPALRAAADAYWEGVFSSQKSNCDTDWAHWCVIAPATAKRCSGQRVCMGALPETPPGSGLILGYGCNIDKDCERYELDPKNEYRCEEGE